MNDVSTILDRLETLYIMFSIVLMDNMLLQLLRVDIFMLAPIMLLLSFSPSSLVISLSSIRYICAILCMNLINRPLIMVIGNFITNGLSCDFYCKIIGVAEAEGFVYINTNYGLGNLADLDSFN